MASVCVPAASPSIPHSVPQQVAEKQHATFMVPLQSAFPVGTEDCTLSFQLDQQIDLVFTGIGKVLTSRKTVDKNCTFTATGYSLTGTFRGTTFVDVKLDGTPVAAIRVDVTG